jgi:hypothetical protein
MKKPFYNFVLLHNIKYHVLEISTRPLCLSSFYTQVKMISRVASDSTVFPTLAPWYMPVTFFLFDCKWLP